MLLNDESYNHTSNEDRSSNLEYDIIHYILTSIYAVFAIACIIINCVVWKKVCKTTIIFFVFLTTSFSIRAVMFTLYALAKNGKISESNNTQQLLEYLKILPSFLLFTSLSISLFACLILLKYRVDPQQELIRKYKIFVLVGNIFMYFFAILLSLLEYKIDSFKGPSFIEDPTNSVFDIALQIYASCIYFIGSLFVFIHIIFYKMKNKVALKESRRESDLMVKNGDINDPTEQQKSKKLSFDLFCIFIYMMLVFLVRSILVAISLAPFGQFKFATYDLIYYVNLEVVPMVVMTTVMLRRTTNRWLGKLDLEESIPWFLTINQFKQWVNYTWYGTVDKEEYISILSKDKNRNDKDREISLN